MNRLLVNTIHIFLIFYTPVWGVLLMGIFFTIWVPFMWYEFILIGLILDIIHGPIEVGIFYIPLYFIIFGVLFLLLSFLRKRMSLHV